MIGITLTNSNVVVADAQPWIATAVDPCMTLDVERTGAGASA